MASTAGIQPRKKMKIDEDAKKEKSQEKKKKLCQIKNEEFGDFLKRKISALFRSEFRCDVELTLRNGSTLGVHGVILDCHTDRFRSAKPTYDLDLDLEHLEPVIGYFYTGSLDFEDLGGNLNNVLKAAEVIQAHDLCRRINEFKSKKRKVETPDLSLNTTTTTTSTTPTKLMPTTSDVYEKYKSRSTPPSAQNRLQIINSLIAKNPKLIQTDQLTKFKLLERASNGQQKTITITVKPVKCPKTGKKTLQIIEEGNAEKVEFKSIPTKPPFTCGACNIKSFKSYFDCRYHHATVHNLNFDPKSCDICGFQTKKKRILLFHRFTKHGKIAPDGIEFPKCNKCAHVSLTNEAMKKHLEAKHARKAFQTEEKEQSERESEEEEEEEEEETDDEGEENVQLPNFQDQYNGLELCNIAVPVNDMMPQQSQQQHQQMMQQPAYLILDQNRHQQQLQQQQQLHQEQFFCNAPYGTCTSELCTASQQHVFVNQMDNYYNNHGVMQQQHDPYMQQQPQQPQQQNGYWESNSSSSHHHHHQHQIMYQYSHTYAAATAYAASSSPSAALNAASSAASSGLLQMPTSSSRSSPASTSSGSMQPTTANTQTNEETQNLLFEQQQQLNN